MHTGVKKSLYIIKMTSKNKIKMEQMLEKRVKLLENEVKQLKEKLSVEPERETVFIDETITYEKARNLILNFLKEHKDRAYYSDELEKELHIDIFLAMRVLHDLEKEGLVK